MRFSLIVFFTPLNFYAQIANYVSNGSFELNYNCLGPNSICVAKSWRTIDSSVFSATLFYNSCYGNTPFDGASYQKARTGQSFAGATFLCQPPQCSPTDNRGYARNRLKSTLQPGKTYCVNFYVNIRDNSSYGIDAIGAFFGNNNLDTITKVGIPLTYLVPQIQNPINNLIIDTMNWVVVTGTFIATGNEKYMIIGNFKSDANTNKILINPNILPTIGADVLIDDVSCIPLDLPAYAAAGSDIWAIPGNTLYLGRPQDVGIDEACMWYKLPNNTNAIDTAAGITVTVGITTNTYIVRQEICGNIKWDTVVVHASGLGLNEAEYIKNNISIFPNPTNDILNISFNLHDKVLFSKIIILNNLGQILKEEEINFKNKTATIKTDDLENGVYVLVLSSSLGDKRGAFSKRFVIAR